MALIKCHECGAQVSDQAAACPHCGAKSKPKTTTSTKIWAAAFAALVAVTVFSPKREANAPPETAQQKAEKAAARARFSTTAGVVAAVKASLREPDSAKWEEIRANDDASVVCIIYRARNGFGGVNLEKVSFVKGALHREATPWDENCAGKDLYNMKSVAKAL
jgi:DNA-directed RNA polymerase subunit RPC12/RpoP